MYYENTERALIHTDPVARIPWLDYQLEIRLKSLTLLVKNFLSS